MIAENISSYFLTGLASLQTHATDWFVDKALGWPAQPSVNKIDLHHHFVPDFFAQAIEENGGDASGWPTPSWSPLSSRLVMKHLGVQTAILSATAPGPCILPNASAQAGLARRLNEYAADLRDEDPLAFGFFASLPDPVLNTTLAVAELDYALNVLGADGVTLFTRYGSGPTYLGHPDLDPLWAALDARNATVFVHPTYAAGSRPVDNPHMPLPLIDFPHETTRAAVDMITRRTPSRYPHVRIVLSHAGGSLPYLASRFITPLRKTPDIAAGWMVGTAHAEAVRALRSFYYDVALSSSPQVLRLLLELVPRDHIVYGSDFPYAPSPAYPAFLEDLESFEMDKDLRDNVNFKNAHNLVHRFSKQLATHNPALKSDQGPISEL